jgi:hypothetical protein
VSKLILFLVCIPVLALWLTVGLSPAGTESSAPPLGEMLEDLRYQVAVWLFPDAIAARVTFKRLEPGRYRAEVQGRAQGFLGVLSGRWQGVYATDMIYAEGKLLPLLYREESQNRGKKNLNEYRFDYPNKVVELYKWDQDKQVLSKRWEAPLNEPMYDALTFYYNQRLNGMVFQKGGDALRFQGIPYPEPEDIVLRIGPDTPQGRKIMVTLDNRIFENERNEVYAFLDKDGVATEAWTNVLRFGKVTGKLLLGGKRLNNGEWGARAGPGEAGGKTGRRASPAG